MSSQVSEAVIQPARWRPEPSDRDGAPFGHISASDYMLVNGPAGTLASGRSFPPAFTVASHSHDRDQVLYSGSGMITVSTDRGSWLLPPERALWIPKGTVHSVTMIGPVLTRSVFIDPALGVRPNKNCEVIVVSPLLHELLMSAHDYKGEPDDLRRNMLMAMVMLEVRRAPVDPLALAIPTTRALAARCGRYLSNPTPHERIDDWCDELGMSRRAFTRLFRRETGQSFAGWRQKACLFAALPRLAQGETVTSVAYALGYSSTAAFTCMFRRVMGATPRHYFEHGDSANTAATLTDRFEAA